MSTLQNRIEKGEMQFFQGKKVCLTIKGSPEVKIKGRTVRFATKVKQGKSDVVFSGSGRDISFTRQVTVKKGSLYMLTAIRLEEETELVSFVDKVMIHCKNPDFVFTPNLCPEEKDVVGDHVFRSPAVILHDESLSFALVPDLDVLKKQRFSPLTGDVQKRDVQIPMFIDLRKGRGGRDVLIGLADYEARPHVYYSLTDKPVRFRKGTVLKIGCEIILENDKSVEWLLKKTTSFLWKRYAGDKLDSVLPQKMPFGHYSGVSYRSILATTEFRRFKTAEGLDAAGFRNSSSLMVNDIKSSYFRIPPRCVWFYPWWNSLRTAFGMYYWGQKNENRELCDISVSIKKLVLSSPDFLDNGLIPGIYDYDNKEWWCGVTRLGAGKDIYDLTASSHTAQWMLRWYRYLEKDERLIERAGRIADYLLKVQNKDGSFPGYVDRSGKVKELLNHSGQSGMASLFLTEYYRTTGDKKILDAIVKSCRFYIKEIIPVSKYHDFETFFSCSYKPLDFYDKRTGQHAQNTLSLFWIAQTLLNAHTFTKDREFLMWGLRCLDHLSLYQQVWNPPYLSLYTFGGFASMNTDGEWNDMRQVFFAELYMQAYLITGRSEYFQRGISALRAGYALLCHPLHKDINPLRYDSYSDGLAPENFAHNGADGRTHRSGFDWGGGAVANAAALCRINFGDLFVDLDRNGAFGIDGIVVKNFQSGRESISLEINEQTGIDRNIKVVFLHKGRFLYKYFRIKGGRLQRLEVKYKDLNKFMPIPHHLL